jgi:cold shock protein
VTDTAKHFGTVKFYGDKGAWGFLTPDDGSKDMFVHETAVGAARLRELNAGDRVEYSIEVDKRSGKPCATNLKLILRGHTMFGMKPFNTKVDHVAAFKKIIDMAISEARDAHVGSSAIAAYLRSHAKMLDDQAYQGQYVPPRMYDASTGKLIDYAKQAEDARAERQRRLDAACEIPVGERQSAASGHKVP